MDSSTHTHIQQILLRSTIYEHMRKHAKNKQTPWNKEYSKVILKEKSDNTIYARELFAEHINLIKLNNILVPPYVERGYSNCVQKYAWLKGIIYPTQTIVIKIFIITNLMINGLRHDEPVCVLHAQRISCTCNTLSI